MCGGFEFLYSLVTLAPVNTLAHPSGRYAPPPEMEISIQQCSQLLTEEEMTNSMKHVVNPRAQTTPYGSEKDDCIEV